MSQRGYARRRGRRLRFWEGLSRHTERDKAVQGGMGTDEAVKEEEHGNGIVGGSKFHKPPKWERPIGLSLGGPDGSRGTKRASLSRVRRRQYFSPCIFPTLPPACRSSMPKLGAGTRCIEIFWDNGVPAADGHMGSLTFITICKIKAILPKESFHWQNMLKSLRIHEPDSSSLEAPLSKQLRPGQQRVLV